MDPVRKKEEEVGAAERSGAAASRDEGARRRDYHQTAQSPEVWVGGCRTGAPRELWGLSA